MVTIRNYIPTRRLLIATPAILLLSVVVFAPAVPAAGADDSVLGLEPGTRRLCNDDVGVILWGPDTAPTLSVGKSDVWDRRKAAPIEPVLTLARITEMARAGDPAILNGQGYYSAYGSYDFPCPKPVGQIILRLDFIADGGTLTVDGNDKRSISLRAAKGDKSLELRIFVSAVRNLIVIAGEATALSSGDMAVRLYRHRDTIVPGGKVNPTLGDRNSNQDFEQLAMPSAGGDQAVFWIAQDFPADLTFPKGFTSVLAACVTGAATRIETKTGQTGLGTPMLTAQEGRIHHGLYKRFTPINRAPVSAATARFEPISGSFQLIVAVATTQDDPDPLRYARRQLAEAVDHGEPALWDEHVRQLAVYDRRPHARAWSKDGKTEIDYVWGGVPYRIRPAGYYGDVPLCSVDGTKFCFQDSSIWHADFHFNEVEATSQCILHQFDVLDPYFRMIHEMLPMAQANAREVYDCDGAMYPLVHYPLKARTVIHGNVTWEQSMEITALLAKPFWLRFLYTWDVDFLRDLAYPVLREGARFYASFLKQSDDGLYHVFPTVSPEHRGITKDLQFNKDTQSAITLIRYHLRAASRAAKLLNIDTDEASRWTDITEHMPGYPTVETAHGPIFIDVAGAQPVEYNVAVPLTSVFWGDDIGLDSPPEQIELARRTLELIDVWPPHRGYLRTVRRRLGIYEPDDGVAIENFLQSHTGVIRVFPAVPEGFEGGFENLGAQGAFVVSAERTEAGVQSITLESLAGKPCTLARPDAGRSWQVYDMTANKEIPTRGDDRALVFDTVTEHTYHVHPGRPTAQTRPR